MSARSNSLRRAAAASPVHLAVIRRPAEGSLSAYVLMVDLPPREHPWIYVARLDSGMCNWEPMSGWNDLVEELTVYGVTPDNAWQPAESSRVQLANGSWVALLERDMSPAARAEFERELAAE